MMKRLFCMLCLIPLVTHAIEHDELNKMLASAANAQGKGYFEARTAIIDLGPVVVPLLKEAADDTTLNWQQRLVARICHERTTRVAEISALRFHNWKQYKPYRLVLSPKTMGREYMGPSCAMGPFVISQCREARLWYYYIELNWKQTGEHGEVRPKRDAMFEARWPLWCRDALQGQPEESYLVMEMANRLEKDVDFKNPESPALYKSLRGQKHADAIPVLIERCHAFYGRTGSGAEVFPGARAMSFRERIKSIMLFADSRHVELLEKFIDKHSELAELKPLLEDVRARPAPVASKEPKFVPITPRVVSEEELKNVPKESSDEPKPNVPKTPSGDILIDVL